MKEFDTFLARVQARRAWLERVAANCRDRVRRERQEERMQTRRIFLSVFLAAVWVVAGALLANTGASVKLKHIEAENAALEVQSAELAEENARLLSELWRLDELMEQGNRDGFEEFDAAMDPRGLYVEESSAIYDALAWYAAGEFRIFHYHTITRTIISASHRRDPHKGETDGRQRRDKKSPVLHCQRSNTFG